METLYRGIRPVLIELDRLGTSPTYSTSGPIRPHKRALRRFSCGAYVRWEVSRYYSSSDSDLTPSSSIFKTHCEPPH